MIYILIVISLAILSLIEFIELSKVEVNIYYKQLDRLFYLYFAALLFILTAFRYKTGRDYINYLRLFDTCLTSDNSVFETGYLYLNQWFKIYTGDFYIMQVCVALVSCYGVFRHFFQNAKYPCFVLFLFFITYFFSTNLMQTRQFLAIGIICYGIPFIKKRRFLQWCSLIVLAAQFHITAVLAFPIYFTYRMYISKFTAFCLLGLSVVINLFGRNIIQTGLFILSFFVSGGFSRMINDYIFNPQFNEAVNYSSGLGYIAMLLIYFYLILIYSKNNKDVFMLNFLLGILLTAMARNFETFLRIAYYYDMCGNGFLVYGLLGKKISLYKKIEIIPLLITPLFLLFRCIVFFRGFVAPDKYGFILKNDVSPYKAFIFHTDWSTIGTFSLLLVISIGFMVILFKNISGKRMKRYLRGCKER